LPPADVRLSDALDDALEDGRGSHSDGWEEVRDLVDSLAEVRPGSAIEMDLVARDDDLDMVPTTACYGPNLIHRKQESPAVAREDAVQPIQFRLQ